MIWKRCSSEPITVESRVRVYNDAGQEGFVKVRWNQFRHAELYGCVYTETKHYYNGDGSEYQEPDRVNLDTEPTFS